MANGDSRLFGPISGLSENKRVSGVPTSLATMAWVTVLQVENLARISRLTGIKFSLSGTSPVAPTYRVVAKRQSDDEYRVIAPYDPAGQDVVDQKVDVFVDPMTIPSGGSFRIQVYTEEAFIGSSAQVDFLNMIEYLA